MADFRSAKPSWVLGQSAGQTIGAGAATDLIWDVVDWQDPAVFDGVSTITVDRPGLYLIGAHITRAAAATASPLTVRLRLNGTTWVLNQAANTANAVSVPVTALKKLAAGDQVLVNATLHNTVAQATSAPSTEFWGARIGPERWT